MEKKKITPMLKQFLDIKEKHPDKILLFRMGDFYETFFDDAKIVSKILGITLTARDKKAEQPVPLAGFPHHALENYLDKLVKRGRKVVICEQLEDPRKAKGLVKRGIVDIITPGSILDDKIIAKTDHNFLAAIYHKEKKIGFALIDISTGDFLFTEFAQDKLANELQRTQPVEIVVENESEKAFIEKINLENALTITIYESWFFDPDEAKKVLQKHFHTKTLEGFGAKGKSFGITAAGMALAYLKSLKNNEMQHVIELRYYSLDNFMRLDEISRRNLELTHSLRYGKNFGTLISVLDKTQTPMGARKLKDWMLNPLLDKNEINSRLDAVETLIDNFTIMEDLRAVLSKIGDLSRIISKVGTMRINPRDVLALKDYLSAAPLIFEIIAQLDTTLIKKLQSEIEDYSEIFELIEISIKEDPPLLITEGSIFKAKYDEDLDDLREVSKNGKSWIARLENEEKEKTKIPSLKVGYNKVFGYYLEVTKTHKDKIPEHYICKQTLVNSERYISPKLKEYEAKVLGAEERIKNLEYELFLEIRQQLNQKVALMQKFVYVVAYLDVLTNFAYLAYKRNYHKPIFNEERSIQINNSRHPVIEYLLEEEEFIPNDVMMDHDSNMIILITGPNMAGKSTYLRQVGLLAIMAQMGSFIPAEKANIPIFDHVFTRVGAADNLAMGQSTFLVEMIETANILNSATNDSLILLDEIGRGTSTFDGLSLAWAIVEHIHNNPKIAATTLFATHYHELTELENILPKVKNFNIQVKEWNDEIIFLRKIKRGSADQSYGIQVARLAGIPKKVIKRAKIILKNLEAHELSPQGLSANARKVSSTPRDQLDIFDVLIEKNDKKDKILEEIKNLDLNNLTPLEAINKLSELKDKL